MSVRTKTRDLREQSDEQLSASLADIQNQLFRLRIQRQTERLEAPSEIIKAKREIARVKTLIRERELKAK
jgi:large subunit ribosomal protein L29